MEPCLLPPLRLARPKKTKQKVTSNMLQSVASTASNPSAKPANVARRGLRDITNVTTGPAASGKLGAKPAAAKSTKAATATNFFSGEESGAAPRAELQQHVASAEVESVEGSSLYNRREADDIDARDASNPLMVTHYVQEIYAHMRQKEINSVSSTYMQRQPHINEKMRSILIDWLVRFSSYFFLTAQAFCSSD